MSEIKFFRKHFLKVMRSGSFKTNRLDAFSDGVFAIVITLLILELRVPEIHGSNISQELLDGLQNLVPKFLSFVVSFIYITIYWINHHQLFQLLKRADRGIFWLNSLFLMCLTFIPFPTALIGSYIDQPVAVIFYGIAMLATAVSFVAMKIYVFGAQLVEVEHSVKPQVFYLWAGPSLYVLAIFLALIHVGFALAIYVFIPVIYFLAGGLEDKTG